MFSPDRFTPASRPAPFQVAEDPQTDISVVIVSYNTRDVTLQAVRSVLAEAGSARVEVIVVDNVSQDGSAEAIRAACPQVRVIDSGHNGGYAWGNNVGIAQARGRYILVLNPDTLMHPGTLEGAVAALESDSMVGVLGVRVLYGSGGQQSTRFRALRLSHLAWRVFLPFSFVRRSALFGDQRYASRSPDEAQDVEIVTGCFMMLPRRVIEEVGAMDDRFFMYSEESEWCWRIRRAGYTVRYLPDLSITHFEEASTGGESPWKSEQIVRGHIQYLRFTRSPLVAWVGTALMMAGALWRMALALPAAFSGRGAQTLVTSQVRLRVLSCALADQPEGQKAPPQPGSDNST